MKLLISVSVALLMFAVSAAAQEKITDININVVPKTAVIRPNETAVVQIEFFGEKKKGFFDKIFADEKSEGKLQISDWKCTVEPGNGFISKPFLIQAAGERTRSGLGNFIKQSISSIAAKDAVLFTAPEKTGTYKLTFSRGDVKKEVSINVSNSARSDLVKEKVDFDVPKNVQDKYFALAEHYAPFIAQETWFEPKADYLARFDFDGNWRGDDNWENLKTGSSQAFVYYAAMETESHWFLIYNLFHPRDYSDFCVVGTCHENDNEGLILTIRKDRSEFGKLEVMETLAHNNIYSFSNDNAIKNGVHDIDGTIDLYDKDRPVVFIEAGGHGVFGSGAKQSLFDAKKGEFRDNTGVTYIYKARAERPANANDRLVGYALLPIYQEWWTKGTNDNGANNETFENFFSYEPAGGRPGTASRFISGAFHGRTASSNMAKPFWAWHDNRTKKKKLLATGQWALDPAYSVSLNLNFPKEKPFSLRYVYNRFLRTN